MSELIRREDAIKATWQEPSFTDPYNVLTEVRDRIQALPTASPWHRVEEELPDDTRDVLAVRRYGNDLEKQEVIVAHLSVIMDMKRGFDRWWNATNITHWMPFPEPPKEDA